ncbi:MAG: hypothetical protein GF309_10200 [Candidatus Lokiarchaeota archaeon]|nr:hypothetical protein [Candidatus Lokiarchaeota archaeon]
MRMEPSVYQPNKLYPLESIKNEESIKMQVFSNDACMFHDETMKLVRSVAQELSYYGYNIRIIDKSIEDCEKENIVALPTLMIGNTQITGLPSREELSELIRKCIPHRGLDLQ